MANCFVLAKNNILGFQVATSVLKVLALLLYGEVSYPGSATPFHTFSLLERKKQENQRNLSEVPYAASAGLLAFATGPISKFTSSVLEHFHERLVRQSRG